MLTCCHQVYKLREVLFPTQAILATLASRVLEHIIQKDMAFCSSHTHTKKEYVRKLFMSQMTIITRHAEICFPLLHLFCSPHSFSSDICSSGHNMLLKGKQASELLPSACLLPVKMQGIPNLHFVVCIVRINQKTVELRDTYIAYITAH